MTLELPAPQRMRLQLALKYSIGAVPLACIVALLVSWSRPTVVPQAVEPALRSDGTDPKRSNEESTFPVLRNIKGRIVFVGDIPERRSLVVSGDDRPDSAYCTKTGTISDESLLIDPATRGVSNVFVYFSKRPTGASSAATPETHIPVRLEGCRIHPHAVFGRTTDVFRFEFADEMPHNLQFLAAMNSSVCNNPAPGGVDLVRFNRPERKPIEVRCAIHSWMRAHVLVLDHGYAAVTNEAGEFLLANVPSGMHVLALWHERSELRNQSLSLSSESDLDLGEIAFDGETFRRK